MSADLLYLHPAPDPGFFFSPFAPALHLDLVRTRTLNNTIISFLSCDYCKAAGGQARGYIRSLPHRLPHRNTSRHGASETTAIRSSGAPPCHQSHVVRRDDWHCHSFPSRSRPGVRIRGGVRPGMIVPRRALIQHSTLSIFVLTALGFHALHLEPFVR